MMNSNKIANLQDFNTEDLVSLEIGFMRGPSFLTGYAKRSGQDLKKVLIEELSKDRLTEADVNHYIARGKRDLS